MIQKLTIATLTSPENPVDGCVVVNLKIPTATIAFKTKQCIVGSKLEKGTLIQRNLFYNFKKIFLAAHFFMEIGQNKANDH